MLSSASSSPPSGAPPPPAPGELRGVLGAAWWFARCAARILSAIASALFAFAKWAWKQAHFALGAMITSLAGVFLAVALDTSPLVTAGLTATLGWSLFCSTEDLAWMHQRGYVSPAYVRLALTRLADKIGVSDADDYDARRVAEEEELAKLLEELERAPRNSDAKPPEWTADAMPGEKHKNNSVKTAEKTDAADDGISPASAGPGSGSGSGSGAALPADTITASDRRTSVDRERDAHASALRLEYLKRRREWYSLRSRAMAPLRLLMRLVLRWQGLIRAEDEERAELERLRGLVAGGAYGGGKLLKGGSLKGGKYGDEKDGGERQTRGNHARASRIPKRALPHPATWPHRPVFVRFSPRDHGTQRALSGWATRWGPDESAPGSKAPPSAVDLNCPVNTETCMSFESELFVGKIICRFKGIGCPANPSAVKTKEEHFRRKRCTFQVLVQGRFKEAVATHLILTGGEFAKPFTDRPPTYLVSAGCKFFAHLTPGLELDLLCDEPYYVATLGGTVTTLSVDDAEDAPDPTDLEVRENNAKMGASVVNGDGSVPPKNNSSSGGRSVVDPTFGASHAGAAGTSVSKRCRVLGDPATARRYYYNTEDVYTFDYFQSVLLFDSYCLDIGIVKLKLDRHVNGQPLGIMAKHADGRYVYNFEIFHECLLPKSDQAPSGFK